MSKVTDSPIIILMATYNGEKYLTEQLESIRSQTYTNWILYIRDDGSTDKTIDILKQYTEKDKRIKLIKDDLKNLGQCQNFNELMKKAKLLSAKYVMFADQDDVWEPEKIELSLNCIKSKEVESNAIQPCLVYTNYNKVDKDLNFIQKRFGHEVKKEDLNIANKLFVQNWILGCTMIINHALLSSSLEISKEAENHDHWIAIVAALTGKVIYLDRPTLDHRIHERNVTTSMKTTKFSSRAARLIKRYKNNALLFEKRQKLLHAVTLQIKKIEMFKGETKENIESYYDLLNLQGIKAVHHARKNQFVATSKMQTLLFYVQLLIRPKYK